MGLWVGSCSRRQPPTAKRTREESELDEEMWRDFYGPQDDEERLAMQACAPFGVWLVRHGALFRLLLFVFVTHWCFFQTKVGAQLAALKKVLRTFFQMEISFHSKHNTHFFFTLSLLFFNGLV